MKKSLIGLIALGPRQLMACTAQGGDRARAKLAAQVLDMDFDILLPAIAALVDLAFGLDRSGPLHEAVQNREFLLCEMKGLALEFALHPRGIKVEAVSFHHALTAALGAADQGPKPRNCPL